MMNEINWNTAGWRDFLDRQAQLRKNAQATILFVPIDDYQDGKEKSRMLSSDGFEANINTALNGVSIFIETNSELQRLQKFILEHGLILKMSIPRS